MILGEFDPQPLESYEWDSSDVGPRVVEYAYYFVMYLDGVIGDVNVIVWVTFFCDWNEVWGYNGEFDKSAVLRLGEFYVGVYFTNVLFL